MQIFITTVIVVLVIAGGVLIYQNRTPVVPTPITQAPPAGSQVPPGAVLTDVVLPLPVQVPPVAAVKPPTNPSPAPVKNARTLYEGYVDIVPMEFATLEAGLQAQGCFDGTTNTNWPTGKCVYKKVIPPAGFQKGLQIFPHGAGFGPVSFYLTGTRLSATKDIAGAPDTEKFAAAITRDIESIKNMVTIKAGSLQVTKTTYPWTALY